MQAPLWWGIWLQHGTRLSTFQQLTTTRPTSTSASSILEHVATDYFYVATWNWYSNLTIDGSIYPSEHFAFGTVFVCQAGNLWTHLRIYGEKITSQLSPLCFIVHCIFERTNVAAVREMENVTQASDYVMREETVQSDYRRWFIQCPITQPIGRAPLWNGHPALSNSCNSVTQNPALIRPYFLVEDIPLCC